MIDVAEDINLHIKALRRYAMALTGHPSDADDLVQETLKRALVYARHNGEIRDLRAYLFRVLRNVRLNDLATLGRNGEAMSLDDAEALLVYPPTQDLRMECNELAAGLQRLSEEQRETILLVCLEGLTYQEAAATIGVPVGTVMSRLCRGREALRRYMTDGRAARIRRIK